MAKVSCIQCGEMIDTERDTHYVDEKNKDKNIYYCFECSQEELKVPVLPSPVDTVKRFFSDWIKFLLEWTGGFNTAKIILVFLSAIIFPSITVIAPGWFFKLVYATLGLVYFSIAIIWMVGEHKKHVK
jgi:hypothetical protein